MVQLSNQTFAENLCRRFGDIVLRIELLRPLSKEVEGAIESRVREVEEIIEDEKVEVNP